MTAVFAVSWDGRMMERQSPEKGVDAVLYADVSDRSDQSDITRVLVTATGRVDPRGRLFQGAAPVIVYSPGAISVKTQAAFARMPHVRLHQRTGGPWPLRNALDHLRAAHGIRRLALAAGPELFRRLAIEGLLDELLITWRPCILGGSSAPPITGMQKAFLPHGIELDLLELARRDTGCLATYRVRGRP